MARGLFIIIIIAVIVGVVLSFIRRKGGGDKGGGDKGGGDK